MKDESNNDIVLAKDFSEELPNYTLLKEKPKRKNFFSSSKKIFLTIDGSGKNGNNGKNGYCGKNGHTGVIGLTGGSHSLLLNDFRELDGKKGGKGKNGSIGKNGTNGENGEDY